MLRLTTRLEAYLSWTCWVAMQLSLSVSFGVSTSKQVRVICLTFGRQISASRACSAGGLAVFSVRSMLVPGRQTAAACSAAGLTYLWEQVRFDPFRRRLTCELTLRDPFTGKVSTAWCTLCGAGSCSPAAAASWAAWPRSRVEEEQAALLRVPLWLPTWWCSDGTG